MQNKKSLVAFIFLIFFYSCGYISPKAPNGLSEELDKKYQDMGISKLTADEYVNKYKNWQDTFQSDDLKNLVNESLRNNFSIETARAQLREAKAEVGIEKSYLMPSIGVGESGSKSYNNNTISNQDDYSLGLEASYEVDVWGKNYAKYRSQKLKYKESEAALASVKITTVADLMNLWINLIAAREQITTLEEESEINTKMVDILEAEYLGGSTTFANVLEQKDLVIDIKSQIESAKNQEKTTLRAINIMLGKDPLAKLDVKDYKLVANIPELPNEEINIMVLRERPDVLMAFYKLFSSEWDVKYSKLSMLPSFNIGAGIGFSDDNFSNIFDDWLGKLSQNVSLPVFQGGYFKRTVDLQKALRDENYINYKSTVYNAIKEVKDGLDNEVYYKKQIEDLNTRIDLMEKSLVQVKTGYFNGNNSYFDVLDTLKSINDLKINLILQKENLLLNRVYIYRSIGIGV